MYFWRRWRAMKRVTDRGHLPLAALKNTRYVFFPLQTEPEATPFWTVPSERLLRALDTSAQGLATAEAKARLARLGANELAPPRRFEGLRELAAYVANPLVLVLLVASALAAALGEAVSSLVIALMLALSIGLNFTQAYRSQAAARRLREQVAHTATVVRDGAAVEVPVAAVVPGDVIRLGAGDLVPADARLLAAKDLFLNEAALTGESLPVEKHAVPEGVRRQDLPGAADAVFRGASVVSGTGTALVVHTGSATEFGRIAARLAERPPETEFERGTRRFGMLILKVVVFLVLFAFLVNAFVRRDPLQSFLFAVALAVGLTPELLPMIVSVTLATGAVRMARQRVIVKRLAAIENLGSMDVLCSDKTGTLTRGEVTVARHVDLRGEEDEDVIRLAALNSACQTGLGKEVNGEGLVGDKTLAEIKELDAGSGFDARYKGERVATLAEVLQVCKGKMHVLLDLKETGDDYAERVSAAVRAHGVPRETIVGVRSVAQAKQFRKLLPEAQQIGLVPKIEDIDGFAAAGVETIRLWPDWLKDKDTVARVRKLKCQLLVQAPKGTREEVLALLPFEPECIASDDPGKLLQTLADIKEKK